MTDGLAAARVASDSFVKLCWKGLTKEVKQGLHLLLSHPLLSRREDLTFYKLIVKIMNIRLATCDAQTRIELMLTLDQGVTVAWLVLLMVVTYLST
jgi:hypothetical protein